MTSSPAIRVRLMWLGLLLMAAAGLTLRLVRVTERPMHTDEAVNAFLLGEVLRGEPFRYDAQDRHGPLLPALGWVSAQVRGQHDFASLDEFTLRVVVVVVGALTVLLFGLARREIGTAGVLAAAALWTVNPLGLWFHRDFIHETLYAAALAGMTLFGWRALHDRSWRWSCATGLCAGLAIACKETFVVNFAVIAAALVLSHGRALWHTATLTPRAARLALGMGVALGVTIVAYTWMGRHPAGPLDLAKSFVRFSARAGGEGHEKAWYYYLDLLARDGATLLTIVAALVSTCLLARHGRQRWAVFVAATCFGTIAAYSVIPYKTPWLILAVLAPATLLAGALINRATWRELADSAPSPLVPPALYVGGPILLVAALVMGGIRSKHLVTNLRAEVLAPYAYAHTATGILKLPRRLNALRLKPERARIAVVAADPWPLPWYLRRWPHTGFWQPDQDPGKVDVYITSEKVSPLVEKRLVGRRPEFFKQRDYVSLVLWPPRNARLPDPE